MADLQKPQNELDGKACAAVGQSSLMALYDTLFSQVKYITEYHFECYFLVTANVKSFLMQLDVTSSQLLVTDSDFRDEDFRKQLCETVQSLLALRVIPIFNENDAVSTRKAPYEVSYSLLNFKMKLVVHDFLL